ncbi:hypothetical protein [Streptomyces sp. VNUA74]|uniref:hypothetical protein n=1 Tax=Streptomyces sp. VNUA74 TaxID=3062685 RepID=UPI00280AEED6|nr:hypothetical protein [Streptomyces sp. VNUA74]WML79168.1 hypothetical protein Q3101_04645 [Streptomyces sp. VNUA74]
MTQLPAQGPQWDETAHLMRSPANHQRLLDAMDDVRQGRNLVALTEEQWAEMKKRSDGSAG